MHLLIIHKQVMYVYGKLKDYNPTKNVKSIKSKMLKMR